LPSRRALVAAARSPSTHSASSARSALCRAPTAERLTACLPRGCLIAEISLLLGFASAPHRPCHDLRSDPCLRSCAFDPSSQWLNAHIPFARRAPLPWRTRFANSGEAWRNRSWSSDPQAEGGPAWQPVAADATGQLCEPVLSRAEGAITLLLRFAPETDTSANGTVTVPLCRAGGTRTRDRRIMSPLL
jgi:hypothetical protein